jgi:hypothetical protein
MVSGPSATKRPALPVLVSLCFRSLYLAMMSIGAFSNAKTVATVATVVMGHGVGGDEADGADERVGEGVGVEEVCRPLRRAMRDTREGEVLLWSGTVCVGAAWLLGMVCGMPFWWCRVGKVGLVDSILDDVGRGDVVVGGGGVGTVNGKRDQKLFVVVGEVRASSPLRMLLWLEESSNGDAIQLLCTH